MKDRLPGTTIEVDLSRPDAAEALLSPLFLAGGLMLSQVARLTGLEPYVIQDWVRRGYVAPPVKRRYSRRQFCRIAIINMLKDSLQLEKICALLSYINGQLDDESDDLIDDSMLYDGIVHVVSQVGEARITDAEELRAWCAAALAEYPEPVPGARARVERVLQIILTAWLAGRLKREAEQLLDNLQETMS